jgi:hypothetical protein
MLQGWEERRKFKEERRLECKGGGYLSVSARVCCLYHCPSLSRLYCVILLLASPSRACVFQCSEAAQAAGAARGGSEVPGAVAGGLHLPRRSRIQRGTRCTTSRLQGQAAHHTRSTRRQPSPRSCAYAPSPACSLHSARAVRREFTSIEGSDKNSRRGAERRAGILL